MSSDTEKNITNNKAGTIANTILSLHPKNTYIELHQYDAADHETAVFHSEEELYNSPDYFKYYYRMSPFTDTSRKKVYNTHFGVNVSNTGSNCFDLGDYWNASLNAFIPICESDGLLYHFNPFLYYRFEQFHRLSELNHSEFNQKLDAFINGSGSPFTVIESLWEVADCKGLYILVLDDYACCYIGQTTNIKTRVQQHWRRFWAGTVGIDMFKALDTTRIFVCCTGNSVPQSLIDKLEYAFIHAMDRKFLLNILGGGNSLEFIHADGELGYGSNPI